MGGFWMLLGAFDCVWVFFGAFEAESAAFDGFLFAIGVFLLGV
jgi:hypothetical protein